MVDPGHIPAEQPAARRRGSTRAMLVLAPVLAVVGLVLAFLPVASFLAGLPALAAIVLAVVLLVLGARRLVPALSVLVAVVAVVVAVVVSSVQFGTSVGRFAERLPDFGDTPVPSTSPKDDPDDGEDLGGPDAQGSVDPLAAGRHRITYEVLGDGAARVAYTALVGDSFGASDEPAVDAPHRRTQQVTIDEDGRSARFSMIVSRLSDGDGALGCRISIDGDVVSERSADEGAAVPVANCAVEAR